jgi:CheY-like chemotaxis protein
LVKPVSRDALRDAVRKHLNPGYAVSSQVLVIDDERQTLELVQEVLQGAGLTVILARTGEEGLKALAASHPDAVILDLLMPGMDGFEVLRRIRANPQLRQSPVFILTAKDLTIEEKNWLGTQATGLLQKGPHWRRELVEEVRRALVRSGRSQ